MSEEILKEQVQQYGIEGIKNIVTAANRWYDLVKAVILDDYKLTMEDINDVISIGPGVATSTLSAARTFKQVDDELGDLDYAEIEEIRALAGERLNDPRYLDILQGSLYVAKGVSGLIKKEPEA